MILSMTADVAFDKHLACFAAAPAREVQNRPRLSNCSAPNSTAWRLRYLRSGHCLKPPLSIMTTSKNPYCLSDLSLFVPCRCWDVFDVA